LEKKKNKTQSASIAYFRRVNGELAPGGHLIPQKGISLTSFFFSGTKINKIAFGKKRIKHSQHPLYISGG
jgi:hypothetical protein